MSRLNKSAMFSRSDLKNHPVYIRHRRRQNLKGFLKVLLSLGVLAIVAALITPLFLNTPIIPYSKGQRQGIVRKISDKGIFWKTTEGELMMNANLGTVKLDTFSFSVQDKEVADSIRVHSGKEVVLYYSQYLFVPYRVGSTSYLIDSVAVVKP